MFFLVLFLSAAPCEAPPLGILAAAQVPVIFDQGLGVLPSVLRSAISEMGGHDAPIFVFGAFDGEPARRRRLLRPPRRTPWKR